MDDGAEANARAVGRGDSNPGSRPAHGVPRLVDTLRGRSKADPFVIATAIERNAVVVTGEVLTGRMDKPRIPDVCQVKNIRCISFLEMLRELTLTF